MINTDTSQGKKKKVLDPHVGFLLISVSMLWNGTQFNASYKSLKRKLF